VFLFQVAIESFKMTVKKRLLKSLRAVRLQLKLTLLSLILSCFRTMANLSRNIHFGRSLGIPHRFSIHGSTEQSSMDRVGSTSEQQSKRKSMYSCENCSDKWMYDACSGVAIGLSFFLQFLTLSYDGVEYADDFTSLLCFFDVLLLGTFTVCQLCNLYLSGYFLASLLCLWLFYFLLLMNTWHKLDYLGYFPLPWYIVSIPLYLVPVAFALGICGFYCCFLKAGGSDRPGTSENL
jgi:hypothetical protein